MYRYRLFRKGVRQCARAWAHIGIKLFGRLCWNTLCYCTVTRGMGRRGLRVHVNTLDLRQGLAVSITHAMVYDGAMNTTHASQEGLVARFAAAARGVEERSAGQLYVACWTGRMRVLAPVTREGGLGGARD